MEIKIYRKNSDFLFELNKVRWTMFQKNYLLVFGLIAFLGVFILFMQLEQVEEQFWGPMTSFGLAAILLSGIYIYHSFRSRSRFLKKTGEFIDRFQGQTQGVEILITESGMSYRDFECNVQLKWSAFSHFTEYKGYLFVLTFADQLAGLSIKE